MNQASVPAEKPYLIGVDIGGTNVDVLLVNQRFEICGEWSQPIRQRHQSDPVAIVKESIDRLLEQTAVSVTQVAAVGIGVPGQVDSVTGEVKLAVNLQTPTLPLGSILSAHYKIPVFVENDGNAVTLGTYRFLAKGAVRHLAFVTLGTGVGAGIVIHGELYRGSRGMAGEIGHIVVEDSDFRCQCGKYGCLETFVAGPAIARFGREAAAQQETVLRKLDEITAKDVFDAAAQGDTAASAIVDKVAHYLARALQSLMMSYDVELIYIGGGLSRAGDTLLRPIQQVWERQRELSDMAHTMLDPQQLKMVPPSFRAGAWGAVAVAIDGLPQQYQLVS